MGYAIDLADIESAADRIRTLAHETPVRGPSGSRFECLWHTLPISDGSTILQVITSSFVDGPDK